MWPNPIRKAPITLFCLTSKFNFRKSTKNIPIGSMVLVYMLTWLGYIDEIHVTIYCIHGSYGIFIQRDICSPRFGCIFIHCPNSLPKNLPKNIHEIPYWWLNPQILQDPPPICLLVSIISIPRTFLQENVHDIIWYHDIPASYAAE